MSKDSKDNKGKRRGVWSEVKTFEDPDSNLVVIVSERIRGRHEFSMQFAHRDKMGMNRYIPFPCPGAKHDFKDIMSSLAGAATQFIEEQTAAAAKKSEEEKKAEKPKDDKKKPRRDQHRVSRKTQGGLSTLAKKDAAEQGIDRGSQTERKKKKK